MDGDLVKGKKSCRVRDFVWVNVKLAAFSSFRRWDEWIKINILWKNLVLLTWMFLFIFNSSKVSRIHPIQTVVFDHLCLCHVKRQFVQKTCLFTLTFAYFCLKSTYITSQFVWRNIAEKNTFPFPQHKRVNRSCWNTNK